jgi:hypothetical protein
MDRTGVESANSGWNDLYKISGVAALIAVALMPVSIIAYFIWPVFPDDIFTVIQTNRLAGIMSLDFLYLVSSLFAIPVFLALYVTLKRTNASFSAIALALGFIGLVSLIPARPIVEMLVLSDRYAVATTDAQRALFMAAGEATLARFRGTAFNAHYILGSASLLISSLIMLRSDIFSKTTAYVGIVSNVVVFGLYVPVIGVYLSMLSVAGYLVWHILIARHLFRLAATQE